jgi:hypothetical protein
MSRLMPTKINSITMKSSKRKNFLNKFQNEKSKEFRELTASQFIDIWNHYDSDGELI